MKAHRPDRSRRGTGAHGLVLARGRKKTVWVTLRWGGAVDLYPPGVWVGVVKSADFG